MRLEMLADHELVIDNFAGGGGASTGVEAALGRSIDIAINHDPQALASTCRDGQPADEPMATVSAQGTHLGEVRAFLMSYYGVDQDPRLIKPMPTVTSKDRLALVMVQGQPYVIADIGMRMLTPRELFRAQGFPDDYIIDRGRSVQTGRWMGLTKTAQVRMCGNSVSPPVAAALVRAQFSRRLDAERVA